MRMKMNTVTGSVSTRARRRTCGTRTQAAESSRQRSFDDDDEGEDDDGDDGYDDEEIDVAPAIVAAAGAMRRDAMTWTGIEHTHEHCGANVTLRTRVRLTLRACVNETYFLLRSQNISKQLQRL